jgi:hypothetical protein
MRASGLAKSLGGGSVFGASPLECAFGSLEDVDLAAPPLPTIPAVTSGLLYGGTALNSTYATSTNRFPAPYATPSPQGCSVCSETPQADSGTYASRLESETFPSCPKRISSCESCSPKTGLALLSLVVALLLMLFGLFERSTAAACHVPIALCATSPNGAVTGSAQLDTTTLNNIGGQRFPDLSDLSTTSYSSYDTTSELLL